MIALGLNDIEPGMVLSKDIMNQNDVVELAEGTVLTGPVIKKLVNRRIDTIYVEDSAISRKKDFIVKYQRQLHVTECIFQEIDQTGSVPAKITEQFVASALQPMIRQGGVIDLLYKISGNNPYEYQHAMNVSILSGMMAKWLHYDETATEEIMMAGLLHDIGKTKLPREIAGKKLTDLNAHEMNVYQEHTTHGYNLLKDNKQIAANVKQAILQHHEHTDCTGYPAQLVEDKIHPYAKIIAIMNKYDNMTNPHEGFTTGTPFSALDEITQKMFSSLDTKISIAFIHNLKESLIGSTVLLSNNQKGEIAYYSQDDYKAAPLIRLHESNNILDLNRHTNLKIIAYNPVEKELEDSPSAS